MGWVRLDDGFSMHPKVISAGPVGMALQVSALCYCNKYLTDGFIPTAVIPSLLPISGLYDEEGNEITWREVVATLVELGIWYEVEGGYQIHDYGDFQPLKKDIEKEREAARIRMQEVRSKKKSCSENVRPNNKRTNDELRKNFGESSPYPKPDPIPNPNLNKQDILNNNVPTPATVGKKFGDDSPPMLLAIHLRDEILTQDPNTKVPKDLTSWAIEADRMIRLDKRDPEEAKWLITWAQNDPFWRANILSMEKFRKQYDKLKRQAMAKRRTRYPPERREETTAQRLLREEMEKNYGDIIDVEGCDTS